MGKMNKVFITAFLSTIHYSMEILNLYLLQVKENKIKQSPARQGWFSERMPTGSYPMRHPWQICLLSGPVAPPKCGSGSTANNTDSGDQGSHFAKKQKGQEVAPVRMNAGAVSWSFTERWQAAQWLSRGNRCIGGTQSSFKQGTEIDSVSSDKTSESMWRNESLKENISLGNFISI